MRRTAIAILCAAILLAGWSCTTKPPAGRTPQPRGGSKTVLPKAPAPGRNARASTTTAPAATQPAPKAPTSAQTPPQEQPPAKKRGLVYLGRFGGDEGPRALIKDQGEGTAVFKAVGQEAFGYLILEVQPDYVLLERGGSRIRLELNAKQP